MKIQTLALVAMAFAATTAQAVVVTPGSGTVQVTAFASGGASPPTDTNGAISTWFTTPTAIGASAVASTTDSNGGTITAHGDIRATWASATAGTITARNFGWDFVNSAGGGAIVNNGGSNWSYTFTPSTNATYTLNYNVTGSGDTFGLWGFYHNVDGSVDYSTINAFNPNSNGTFTALLNGGQTYTVGLQTNANIGAGGDRSGFVDGDFSWTIAGVPEPTSWAMLIAGFGLIGGALRSRRRAFA